MDGAPLTADTLDAHAAALRARLEQVERRARLQAAAAAGPPAIPPPEAAAPSPASAETNGAISNHTHASSLARTPAAAAASARGSRRPSREEDESYNSDNDYGFGQGGSDPHGENFEASSRFPIEERISYHLDGASIDLHNYRVVQLAMILEAGRIVTDMEKTKKEEREEAILEEFKSIAENLPDHMFASVSVKPKLVEKLYNAQTALNGKGLLAKYDETKRECRKLWSNFPVRSRDLPSGTQWKQLVEKYKVECFKKQFVCSVLFLFTLFNRRL